MTFSSLETDGVKMETMTETHCGGDELTWADIFLVPQMYHGHGFGIDIAKEFPDLFAHYSKLEKHPATLLQLTLRQFQIATLCARS